MKIRRLVQWAIVGAGLAWGATATACEDGALTFSFSNIETRMAFSVLANAAGLRPQVDPSVQSSGPLKFVCVPWREAAENLARKHNLRLRIEGGVMYVTR